MINIDCLTKFHNFQFKPKYLYDFLDNFINSDEEFKQYSGYKSVEYLFNKLYGLKPKKLFIQFDNERGIESIFFTVFSNKNANYLIYNKELIRMKSLENCVSYAISKYLIDNNVNKTQYYCGSYNENCGSTEAEYVNNCYDGRRILIKHSL